MRSLLFVLVLLATNSAFAAQGELRCDINGTKIQGYFNGKTLDVNRAGNLAGEDLTQNPVDSNVSRDGKLKFEFSNLSSDGDFGTIITLYLPAKLLKGSNEASISTVQLNQGSGTPVYEKGTCTLY